MPGHPPSTVLDTTIDAMLVDWNSLRTTAFAMTPAQAAVINEAPGLINDPVLGAGSASLAALNLNWEFFFKANFETTGATKILTIQQSLDRQRAVGFVQRLRTYNAAQEGPVFNLNQIA
jgi:hypothetical protein